MHEYFDWEVLRLQSGLGIDHIPSVAYVAETLCGRCVVVRPQPSKLMTRVRFPPPAPTLPRQYPLRSHRDLPFPAASGYLARLEGTDG